MALKLGRDFCIKYLSAIRLFSYWPLSRLARFHPERSRPRGSSSARRGEAKEEDRKTADKAGSKEDEKKSVDKPGVKISRSTLERLSTPRQPPKGVGDGKDAASTPRRESPVTRVGFGEVGLCPLCLSADLIACVCVCVCVMSFICTGAESVWEVKAAEYFCVCFLVMGMVTLCAF